MIENPEKHTIETVQFRRFGIEFEKTTYANGVEKFGFHFLSWLCVFLKNKQNHTKILSDTNNISHLPLLEDKHLTTKTRIGKFLQKLCKREIFGRNGFILTKIKEPVVKDVAHLDGGKIENINIYIESRLIAILGYGLILRSKFLIYKAMDMQALPATRKNNPNKTTVDFT